MQANGEIYYDEGPGIWSVAFECPEDGETYPLWTSELQPLIARITDGIDTAELPLVGSGQEPKELICPSA